MTAGTKISFGYADVGEVSLHYAMAGTGERLVLLLHGFPQFWYSWRHQLEALSDEYTVVAPDLRGYNLSDKPLRTSDYQLDRVVADVVGLIGHFGRDKAAVIGHDWGASVAWLLAMRHPEVLWKLGALQVPPIAIWKRNQSIKQYLASWYMFFFQLPFLPEFALQKNGFAAMRRSLSEGIDGPNKFTDEDIARHVEAWSQSGAIPAMLNYYRANFIKRLFARKTMPQKIDLPTLFIYGEKDKAIVPETVAGVGEMISGPYQEHRFPNGGHWIQQEERDEVTGILRRFLND